MGIVPQDSKIIQMLHLQFHVKDVNLIAYNAMQVLVQDVKMVSLLTDLIIVVLVLLLVQLVQELLQLVTAALHQILSLVIFVWHVSHLAQNVPPIMLVYALNVVHRYH